VQVKLVLMLQILMLAAPNLTDVPSEILLLELVNFAKASLVMYTIIITGDVMMLLLRLLIYSYLR